MSPGARPEGAARVALVTGGARGIGRAAARDLAARGWDVAVCYRTSAQDARTLGDEVAEHGRRFFALRADVARADEAEALVRRVQDELGRLDALVHCAGPFHRAELLEETPEAWRETFDANLHSLFYCARAAAPGMRARGWGRIVGFAIANADKLAAQPTLTAYVIAKTGVIVLARTLARLLAADGITANVISPGYLETGGSPAPDPERVGRSIPAGAIGAPEDAVAVLRFLLSDEARYVTGTNIHVSGGWGL